MAGITAEQAQAQLDLYLAAEAKVLAGQKYELAGRSMTRANLAEIQQGITIWNQRAKDLASVAGGRGRSYVIVAR